MSRMTVSVGMGTAACRAARRRGGGWRAAGGRARPERGSRRLSAGARARGLLYRLWQSSPEMRLGGGAPATVRDASGGGAGCAGMRGERVTTDMHRLDHGDRATPHHDVAWMACPWWARACSACDTARVRRVRLDRADFAHHRRRHHISRPPLHMHPNDPACV